MAKTNKNKKSLEQRLWDAADQLRANSGLKASQYSQPVLGLIFLRFADFRFSLIGKQKKKEKAKKVKVSVIRHREYGKDFYHAQGVMYLPKRARYDYLLNLPEEEDLGKAINEAMKLVEENNFDLKGILPKRYTQFDKDILIGLLKNFSEIPMDVEGDMFGRIYEYFLGEFAKSEGSKGGEFFTPTSIVKLIVEILEPYKGKVFDPACGSGGMFVQSAQFVDKHRKNGNGANKVISVYGQEKTRETVDLCKMNLAVHGLSGDIKQANTIYEDLHKSVGKFDFVMANPPFNVKGIDKEKIKGDLRYPIGLPSTNNANYLWIQIFYSTLNSKGRAGFVMANSASDARGNELEIRKKLIKKNAIDVMITISPNFFYTVTLPVTLWFLDKGKKKTDRKDKILFIDARNIYHQIDRAHRDFTKEQIQKIASIVKSYRKEKGAEKYKDIFGLCKIATVKEIKEQGYSLNAGRYIGIAPEKDDGIPFKDKMEKLSKELKGYFEESHKLEKEIKSNLRNI